MTEEGSAAPGCGASQTLRQALTLKKAVSSPVSGLTEPVSLLQLTAEPPPPMPSPEWASGMNIRPGQFLGALCPSIRSSPTGLRLQRASVSCCHPHHRCCSLHVLFAAGWVLPIRAWRRMRRAIAGRDRPWTRWEQAASGSRLLRLPWIVLVTVTAAEPSLLLVSNAPCFLVLSVCSDSRFPCLSPLSECELLEGRLLTPLYSMSPGPEQCSEHLRTSAKPKGFPCGSVVENLPTMQNPWVRKVPWRRKWQPAPVFFSWGIPWTGAWQSTVSPWSHRVGHNWATKQQHSGQEGKGHCQTNPLLWPYPGPRSVPLIFSIFHPHRNTDRSLWGIFAFIIFLVALFPGL